MESLEFIDIHGYLTPIPYKLEIVKPWMEFMRLLKPVWFLPY